MMSACLLSELESPVKGHLLGADCEVKSVSIDSRQPQAGALFVALEGENFDGHNFIGQAAESGAVAAVVAHDVESALPLLRVADTQHALGLIAAHNRNAFEGTLVAITGSSGKTTVKNMIHAVLSQRGSTLATRGNLNNEIGVPLTLLDLSLEHEFAVVEMGAGSRGDIAWLCELGRPSIALLLNALPAHLEGFGSVEAIAEAKGEIFDELGSAGTAVINADQPWADQWRERARPATVMDYGLSHAAAVTANNIELRGIDGVSFTALTPVGEIQMTLHFAGMHNVSNALAAIAVGLSCKLSLEDIRKGLESVAPVAGRLSVQRFLNGVNVIDDCYNANPGSVRAAIDVLAACPGRRTLVLGAMRELGDDSAKLHREIGAYVREAGIDELWGVGPELACAVEAFGGSGRHFADREMAITALPGAFTAGDTVLIKGSRGAAMEHILSALRDDGLGSEG
ncbi:MAG: UDP-N-acetylmuramoyl-tripeptide--D-alanyl-D-alanine ligase [Halioglobus sp.]